MNRPKIDLDGKQVFLSGPVTGYDRGRTVARFAAATIKCYEAGAAYVFNPVDAVKPSTPHEVAMCRCLNELSMWDFDRESPYYDCILQLDGWEDSEGSRTECAVAQACGIPIRRIWELQ